MAQPDLVAQKIMNTDPQVGFGSSAVLPYRKRELDTRGLEAMERAKTRREAAEQEAKKDNEDFYRQSIGKLNDYNREFDAHMRQEASDLVSHGSNVIRNGGNLKSDPDFNHKFARFQQKAAATKQMAKSMEDIDKLGQASVGKYINLPSYKGEALKRYKNAAREVNSGNDQALQENITPNLNDLEFFKTNDFIQDQIRDIKGGKISNEQIVNSALGQYIKKTEKGYKFSTYDDKGNLVPGINQEVQNYFLNSDTNDPDMLQYRAAIDDMVDKQLRNKALMLKKYDPEYQNIGEDKIRDMISNPNNKHYVDKETLKEGILKAQLEPFQETKVGQGIKSGFKYNTKSGSGDDEFKIVRTYDQERNTSAATAGGANKVSSGWVPEELRFEGKKMDKPLLINSTKIYNEETNTPLSEKESIGDNEFKPTRLMLLPYDTKTGKYLHGKKESVSNNKNARYRWVAAGTIVKGSSSKKVFIPYEEVQPDIKAQYGYDLNERSLSEVSDLELTDQINQQYPDASPQEKIEIFKTIRGR
jgi:hypothetical protein